jgi:hypothetical protein
MLRAHRLAKLTPINNPLENSCCVLATIASSYPEPAKSKAVKAEEFYDMVQKSLQSECRV